VSLNKKGFLTVNRRSQVCTFEYHHSHKTHGTTRRTRTAQCYAREQIQGISWVKAKNRTPPHPPARSDTLPAPTRPVAPAARATHPHTHTDTQSLPATIGSAYSRSWENSTIPSSAAKSYYI